MNQATGLLLCLSSLLLPAGAAHAWSEPHHAITKAALDVLPASEQDLLGKERAPLASDYCLIPDYVFTNKANARFAAMDAHPGEVYLQRLHLPLDQPENFETFRYFIGKAVESVKAGKTGDAARYLGTICHTIEDFGSPSHTLPGDNQFTLLQQFLPPPEEMKGRLLHGPVESGEIEVSIAGYRPQLLGTSVDEAAWHLLHRVNDEIINARSTTIPIIQALYAKDEKAVVTHQLKAATFDARVVADAIHTVLCQGTGKFDAGQATALKSAPIGACLPLEAVDLHYPQTQFFSQPYYGYPRSGLILESGKTPRPLKLNVDEKSGPLVDAFLNGISVGMGKPLTFLIPAGVFHRFTALAGLQAGLGDKGRVEFTVLGDGKPLATAIVNGTEPAHAFDCDLTGITRLQLSAVSRGLDPHSNYAVWAEPMLVKRAD